jgi:PAS domain S-box-containing protein
MDKATILVVEDEGVVAKDLENTLRGMDYVIAAVVSSGEEAVQRAEETKPDLVLMDIMLKGMMDGVEAADQIRARLDIPVVYLTAYADDLTLLRAKITEPFGYLLKPFQERELAGTIELALYKYAIGRRLRESEERHRFLVENATDIFATIDSHRKISYVAPSIERILGYKPEIYIGQDALWPVHPDDVPFTRETLDQLLQNPGTTRSIEHRIKDHDGSWRIFQSIGRCIWDGSGHSVVIVNSRDITECKMAEEALRRSEREAKRLAEENAVMAEIGRIISSTFSIEEVYKLFTEEVKKLLSFDRIAITMMEPEKKSFANPYVEGIAAPARGPGEVYPIGGTFTEAVIRAEKGLIISFEDEEELTAKFPGLLSTFRVGLRSFLSVPLISRQKVVGALHLQSKKYEAYSEEDLRLAEGVATQIAGAIANAQLFYARIKSEEALKESEERYRSILDNIEEGYFEVDIAGNFIFFNDSLCRELGYSKKEMMGMNNRQYMDKERAKEVYHAFNRVYTTGEPYKAYDWEIIRKDGTKRILESSVSLMRNAKGEPMGFRGIVRDVTEKREVEETLRKSEEEAKRLAQENTIVAEIGRIISSTLDIEEIYERFADEARKLIPFDHIAITTIDREKGTLHIAYVSGYVVPGRGRTEVISLAGSLTEEVARTRSIQLIQTEDAEEVTARFPKLLPFWQHGFRSFMAVPLISNDQVVGVLCLYSIRSKAYKEADSNLAEQIAAQIAGAIANTQLFADRKRTEEQLRRSGEHFRLLIENSSDIIIMIDENKNISYASPSEKRMLGYNPEDYMGKDIFQFVHPDDLSFISEAFVEILQNPGTAKFIEHRVRHKDGSWRIFQTIARSILDDSGKAFVIANLRDITERKRVEEALKRAKEFNENVLNSMKEAVAIIDTQDFKIVDLNRTFLDWLGRKKEEVIGKTCYAVIHNLSEPCNSSSHPCPLLHTLKTGSPAVVEHVHSFRDGEKMHVEVSSAPIKNEKGEVIKVVHVERDVTEQKTLQSQLAQAQKLEAIGSLASGIAHEINTPTQYVGDNTRFFKDAFSDLNRLLGKYEELLQKVEAGGPTDGVVREVAAITEEIDLAYLKEEVPKAIQQTLEGVGRVTKIVQAMKEFSHPGTKEKTFIDINKAIENTITVARNEWKYVAEMVTDLDPSLPLVKCLPDEFNQVILNMIINAAHAIADVVGDGSKGKGIITVGTRHDGNWAEIRVSDTGTGIPEDIRSRIFDPFFTTKKVGKGTGQGLTISHSVIVDKHGGTIYFDSDVGKGTTFIIRLPIENVEGHKD